MRHTKSCRLFRFRRAHFYPFRKQTKTRGLSETPESELSFVDLLGFSYGASFSNSLKKSATQIQAKYDTSQIKLDTINDFTNTNAQSLAQNFSLSISPKLGYFTVSPSFSFSDSRTWTQARTPARDTFDSLRVYNSTRSQSIIGNLNTGVDVGTRFYGMFQPNVFGITAFRQTVTPTFSLIYNKQIYGDNMQKYSMTGSFNVGNNFEMKYQKNDSAKTEDKIQLLFIDQAGFSYNFAADSLNFSPIVLHARTQIGQLLNIDGGVSYYPYVYDTAANNHRGGYVNKFLLQENGKFGDLTSVSLNLSTSFKGDKKQNSSETGIPESVKQEQAAESGEGLMQPSQKKMYYSIYDREDADFSIPWNVTLSYNFSQSQQGTQSYTRSSQISASLSFNLTQKWQIATSGYYNFVEKQHYISSVSVTRDLHCWTMAFSWFPMGTLAGYRFELKVKAPQLQDLKITKQSSLQGNYY